MKLIIFIMSAIRLGTTFLFGSTGETITEKSGHLNLGIPGIMCVGASSACLGASLYATSLESFDAIKWLPAIVIPLFCALCGAALMGLLYSFLTVTMHSNQNVTGLAMTTFGIGVQNYMISRCDKTAIVRVSKFYTVPVFPFEDKLGWLGDLVFSYGFMVYLGIIVALAASFVLTKTRLGLHLRAVGENPATADAVGINVTAYRYVATVVGSAVAGLGGMFYIFDYLNGIWEYCVDDLGWLALALVIFTVWRPNVSILGSFLFGAFYIAYNHLNINMSFAQLEIMKMLPYVVTIIVLIFTSIRNRRDDQPPAGLGLNYYREDR